MPVIIADDELLKKARVKLVLDHPFFGVLILHMPCRPGKSPAGTAHVDGTQMVYEPAFVRTLDDEEKMGLVAHEVLHVALGHCFPWRRGRRNAAKWMLAIDYVVNLIVTAAGLKIPKGGLLDRRFEGMSAEKVYEQLPDSAVDRLKAMDVVIELGGHKGKGKDKEPGAGKGKEPGADKDKSPCEGCNDAPEMTPDEIAKMSEKWKRLITQAATVARQRGKLPAGMEWVLKDVVEPKVPWQQILEQFVNNVLRDDYDMMRPDRRFLGGMAVREVNGTLNMSQSIYLPDLYSEGCEVAVAVDTSGSIPDGTLRDFVSEVVAILRTRNVARARILACDASVHLDQILGPMDEAPKTFPGRGGTDFRPVFTRLDDGKFKPACLIFMTDLEGSFPDLPPDYPVLWVSVNKDAEPPFGMSIRYEADE